MAITTLDGYIAAAKQLLKNYRIGNRTSVAYMWYSMFDMAGSPGAGVLSGTDTTAGVVPTSATAGMPYIYPYGTGKAGYLTRMWYTCTVSARARLYDLLWKGGAYAYNADVALTGQPSFASRLPLTPAGDPNYVGLEIWAECATAFTGNQTFNVTYTNQAGVGGKTTGATGVGSAPTLGRLWQLPLQSGDSGVQKVDNVTGAVGSAGAANILIMRPLLEVRCHTSGYAESKGLDDMGFIPVSSSVALYMIVSPDTTVTGTHDMYLEIASN